MKEEQSGGPSHYFDDVNSSSGSVHQPQVSAAAQPQRGTIKPNSYFSDEDASD